MNAAQDVVAYLLAAGVTVLSIFYARQQFRELRRLRESPDLPADEQRRERRQCGRRLAGSALLLIIAALLVIVQLWLEGPTREIARRHAEAGPETLLTDQERWLVRLDIGAWITILVLLFAVIVLAAFDMWAIRRYGRLQHRKLRDDRRAMIEHQLHRLREERDGD